ncbi:CtsR family transcriptional regulator [Sporolactobacillus shoreicorticis]|uniref:Transcriptional regulator CtsR n=1 Tax=Sporolactobacillus shoreicorticis TaxID=1923877 RepID=A0ABW5S9R5_9BACL|nr:CtsR family transcriptional regulator [Sporolactobacillus shoreicorticis]MCO7127479.1 CtsR family transcriptional regulator [Sporolactobacillus shoreicorticis]
MRNISDIIEKYIKEILDSNDIIKLKRSELAEKFQCVPSQINYVLKTRFSIERGYVVESKRGGGGYIRVVKVRPVTDAELIDEMIGLIGYKLTQSMAESIIVHLLEEDVISDREARLMLMAVSHTVLDVDIPLRDELRANLLRAMLQSLTYSR